MSILIAGDLVPTKSNMEMFNNGDVISLLGEKLLNIWNESENKVINLEVPLTDELKPIYKCGPNLVATSSAINGIRALNPTLITLANNHILDQGEEGLKNTLKILKDYNIAHLGAGKNIVDAGKPYIIYENNKSIGVYSCAEHEFTIATESKFGANPFDPMESFDEVQYLKTKCDYVIVLYHGGKEHYRYPSPYLQKVSRKFVKKGADLVICQHSHCIGCYEEIDNSTIVYGQGNFIFDDCDNEYWNTGLLVKVDVTEKLKVDYIPIVKFKNTISLAEGQEANEIMESFNERSREILIEGVIEEKYSNFAKQHLSNYLRAFAGQGIWHARLDKYIFKGLLLKKSLNRNKLVKIQNYIECEAHRELVLQAIKGEVDGDE